MVPKTLESMNRSAYFWGKCVCEEYFRDYIMLFQQIDIIVQNVSQIYFVGIVQDLVVFLALLRSKATTCEMHLQYYDVIVVVCKHRHLYFVYNLIFAPGFMSMSYFILFLVLHYGKFCF